MEEGEIGAVATKRQHALILQVMFGLSEMGVAEEPCQGKGKEGLFSGD